MINQRASEASELIVTVTVLIKQSKEIEMDNVKHEVKDNILTITVDLSQERGPSASGKTIVVASSKGSAKIEEGVYLSLNVFKYAKKA